MQLDTVTSSFYDLFHCANMVDNRNSRSPHKTWTAAPSAAADGPAAKPTTTKFAKRAQRNSPDQSDQQKKSKTQKVEMLGDLVKEVKDIKEDQARVKNDLQGIAITVQTIYDDMELSAHAQGFGESKGKDDDIDLDGQDVEGEKSTSNDYEEV